MGDNVSNDSCKNPVSCEEAGDAFNLVSAVRNLHLPHSNGEHMDVLKALTNGMSNSSDVEAEYIGHASSSLGSHVNNSNSVNDRNSLTKCFSESSLAYQLGDAELREDDKSAVLDGLQGESRDWQSSIIDKKGWQQDQRFLERGDQGRVNASNQLPWTCNNFTPAFKRDDDCDLMPNNTGLRSMNNNLAHTNIGFDNYKEYSQSFGSMRNGTSAMSRESSRDDINSLCEQQFEYEERFRVDRRKLEMMMVGAEGSEFGRSAADFFDRIGTETGTCVIWPTRLKIGAKSKKDPHIRVGGAEEGVKQAKQMITEVLDIRTSSRVTMKMDVSYTDHSHIIGKGGNTIRRVMAETNCHIHFPDSNRSNPNEKSNQVSIAGEVQGVERARARVRELTPLLFQFDLSILPTFQASPDPNNAYFRAIQDQYNVQISFRQRQKNFHTTTCIVKGCEWEGSRVKEATLLLMDHLCYSHSASVPVIMTMEISPQHHSVVIGKGSINLRVIMQRTNTTIIFPDAGDPNIHPIKKGSVRITGAIHNVYLARQQLLGSLPIVMMFDLPDNIDVDEILLHKLQEEYQVSINIRPKVRQGSKSVIIKTQERNVAGIYMARHKLLDLDDDVVKAEIPETYKVPQVNSSSALPFTNLPANRSPYVNTNFNLAQALCSPMSPNCVASQTGFLNMSSSHFPFTQQAAVSDWRQATELNGPPPNPPNTPVKELTMTNAACLGANNYISDCSLMVTHSGHDQGCSQTVSEKEGTDGYENPCKSYAGCQSWSSPQNASNLGPSSSGLGSSMHSSPILSPRNSSPVNASGNFVKNLQNMDLNASSGVDTNQNGSVTDLSAIFSELSGDRRAPGCEKKVVEIAADYEQKRLMANKAIQQKPAGEERTPNAVWSGLGFSHSMPEAVIRERIAEYNRARSRIMQNNGQLFGQSITYDLLMQNDQSDSSFVRGREDLPQLLASQGLAKYTDIFTRHEIDMTTFTTLTDEELKEIGVPTFGARKKLLMLASKISTGKWNL